MSQVSSVCKILWEGVQAINFFVVVVVMELYKWYVVVVSSAFRLGI